MHSQNSMKESFGVHIHNVTQVYKSFRLSLDPREYYLLGLKGNDLKKKKLHLFQFSCEERNALIYGRRKKWLSTTIRRK